MSVKERRLSSQSGALLIISITAITQSQCHLLGSDCGMRCKRKQQKRIIFPLILVTGLIFCVNLFFPNAHKACFGEKCKVELNFPLLTSRFNGSVLQEYQTSKPKNFREDYELTGRS